MVSILVKNALLSIQLFIQHGLRLKRVLQQRLKLILVSCLRLS